MKKLFLLLILSFFSAQGLAAGCPDGSEPVKSISDDGTYFVYNCGTNNSANETKKPNTKTVKANSETTVNWACNSCIQDGIRKQVHLPEDVLSGLSYEKYTLIPEPPDYMMNVLDKSDGHPVRAGNKSIRFEVRPGDCFSVKVADGVYDSFDCTIYPLIEGQGDRERFEIQSEILEIKEHWFSWSIYFPEDFKNNWPIKSNFGQFKERGGWDPIWMFEQYPDGLGVTKEGGINGTDTAHFNLLSNAQAPGKWNDIIIHAKFSKKDDGFFKVWVNNALKVNYKGATMKAKDVVQRFGIYRTGISRYENQKNLKGLKKCVIENEGPYWEEQAVRGFTHNWEMNHDWSKILYEKCNGYYDEIELPNDVVYFDEIRRADSCEELGSLHDCNNLAILDTE